MPDTPDSKDEAFLSRWSRRKRAEPEVEIAPEAPVPAPVEDKTDEEILAELDLPDPDTLTPEDDFSAFMQAHVPERLRRRALRVLWRSNPILANLDELVDYGEDFTDSATVIENMQTVYEVGKGAAEKWKRHLAALAEAEDKDTDGGEEPPAPDIEAEPTETVAVSPPAPQPILEAQPALTPETDTHMAKDSPRAPRPARFSFE